MLTLFSTEEDFLTKIIDLVTDLVTPLAEKRGDELVDVEYVKEKINIICVSMLIAEKVELTLKKLPL